MSRQATVTMYLQSDTIFGSGYSIPGGEDIAVKIDRSGTPYLAGETVKGLAREAMANWLDWTGTTNPTVGDFFGETDNWHASTSNRQVFVSPLLLREDCKKDSTSKYFSTRTFTAIENRMVKEGSLRVASCIRAGLYFCGTVVCESDKSEDLELLTNALRSIKEVGTSRTRGFGQVEVTVGEWQEIKAPQNHQFVGSGTVLCYTLTLNEPVRITNRSTSYDTFLETQGYIPASAVRGAVLNALAREDSQWFEQNKRLLLKELRFCNVLPCPLEQEVTIPTPKGFYADKLEGVFYHLLTSGEVIPNTKRAKLGAYAALNAQTGEIDTWSAKQGENTRIALNKRNSDSKDDQNRMFQTSWLEAGQMMKGAILLPKGCPQEVRERVERVMEGVIRLGAGTHSGCGLCEISGQVRQPLLPAIQKYSYQQGDKPEKVLYLMLLSPLALRNAYGEPCAMSKELLSEKLGVAVTNLMASTSVAEYHGFNRQMGVHLPAEVMYESGCVFRLTCEAAPTLDAVRSLEEIGLGIRREEGFGQLLFLRDLKKITAKAPAKLRTAKPVDPARKKEQLRSRWLNEHSLPDGLSNSQMGELQTKCKLAKRFPNTAQEKLNEWFDDITQRNDNHDIRFDPIRQFVNDVLSGTDIPAGSMTDRLNLLIDLMNYDRKELD